jgi:hypothetical protein
MNANRKLPLFTFEPYWVPKEHLALFSCLNDMYPFLRPGEVAEALDRIFVRGRICNGDPYPWELCRWKERYMALDEEEPEHSLDDDKYPDINPDDFLAWCDPFDFGAENFWSIYTEAELKDCLEQAFTQWAKEKPEQRAEYAAALAEHGMRLRSSAS